jgi:CHAT domain-containing protein
MAKVGLIGPLGLAAALLAPVVAEGQAWESEKPCQVMRLAARAVAVDSAAPFRAAWTERLARNPYDRLALLGIASIDLASGRLNAADSGYHAVALVPAGDALERCANLGVALALYSEGRYAASSDVLLPVAAAARTAGDSAVEAQALLSLVYIESRGRAQAASAHLARADSIIATDQLALRGAALCAQANILIATHGARSAVATGADQGAALARRGADLMVATDCEMAVAFEDALGGEMVRATRELGVVIAHAHQIHYAVGEGIATQWRGYARLDNGQYTRAEDDLERALAIGTATGSLNIIGWSELNLAALYGTLGDWPIERRHAARSRAALTAAGDSYGLGILQRGEGTAALNVGDTAFARVSFMNALRAAESSGRSTDIMAAESQLADLELREGRVDAAAAWLKSEHDLVEKGIAPGWESTLPWKDAGVDLVRRDWPAALRNLAASEPVLDSSQHLFLSQVREDEALAQLGEGDTARAIATLNTAYDQLDRWRASLTTDELRVLAFQTVNDIYAPVDGAAQVTAAAARSGRIAAAFAFAERRRARDLADELIRADALRTASPNGRDTISNRAFRSASTVTLAELQRRIPDDTTAILEYMSGAGPTPTTLIIITRLGARAAVLASADSLSNAIARYDALVEQGAGAAAPARWLGDVLVAPALLALPATVHRLVIVPDGVLNQVAFGALRMADGSPLLVRAAVGVAPSATVLVNLWARPHPPRPTEMLAFGDPVLPHEEIATAAGIVDTAEAFDRGAAAGLDATGQLPRLPWTADEARLVGAFAPQSVVRLRADASESYLEHISLAEFSIIHFATHAVVDEDFPLRSALVLAPGGGASGFVGPGDLAALRLRADLVVLSACRTGRGQIVGGEGVRGLIAPILASGARSVLATRWRLNDRDAVPLVYEFYAQLAKGLTAAEATRRTELSAYRTGAPEREWAAFMLVGDPLVRVPLRSPEADRVPGWVKSSPVMGSF